MMYSMSKAILKRHLGIQWAGTFSVLTAGKQFLHTVNSYVNSNILFLGVEKRRHIV